MKYDLRLGSNIANHQKTLVVRKPLIAILGIGNYIDSENNDYEKSVLQNYSNLKNTFYGIRGFDIVYQTQTNDIKHLTHSKG